MTGFRHKFMLSLMLCKRLYKKPSFVIILALLASLTVAMSVFLGQSSSVVRVAIANGSSSQTAAKISERLLSAESIVSYSLHPEQEAEALLKSGEVDAVWYYAEDFDKALADFAAKRTKAAPITVATRENSVFINLTLERLYAELWPSLSREIYLDFAKSELASPSSAELEEYLDRQPRSEGIVEFSYFNDSAPIEEKSFLVTPLRGMLALILALCSMASVLYYLDDCDRGRMDAVPLNSRYTRVVMYSAAGTVNIAIFVAIALAVTGLTVSAFAEISAMLLLIIGSVGFSALIGGLCAKTSRMAPLLPILLIIMLVACPIFMTKEIPYISQLFAPYWYLISVYNTAVLPQMTIYCVAVNALAFAVWRLRALKMPAK